MITHEDARTYASARADGELDVALATDLDAHITSCPDCEAYAAGLAALSALTGALPRDAAPGHLAGNVVRRIRHRRRRRVAFRLVPAVAALTAFAVVLTSLPGPGAFPLPDAAAAEPLLRLRSLYVERVVTDPGQVVTERIWWRAPGSVRIERRVTAGGTSRDELEIETPGMRFADGVLTTGLPPVIALPEPISPTALLIGTDTGPGPAIAGRATRRIELVVGGERRIALVDASRALGLGGEETLVLGKFGEGATTTKRTTVVRLDPDVPDALFVPPVGRTRDAGFRDRPLDLLRIAPARRPEGFVVVRAGRGPDGDSALFVRGSLPVLVTTGPVLIQRPATAETTTVERDGRTFPVTVDLYSPPSVQLVTRAGEVVTVSAPLPVESLVTLAQRMYPARE